MSIIATLPTEQADEFLVIAISRDHMGAIIAQCGYWDAEHRYIVERIVLDPEIAELAAVIQSVDAPDHVTKLAIINEHTEYLHYGGELHSTLHATPRNLAFRKVVTALKNSHIERTVTVEASLTVSMTFDCGGFGIEDITVRAAREFTDAVRAMVVTPYIDPLIRTDVDSMEPMISFTTDTVPSS